MGCLHDPANVPQTFSKCIQNTRANAGRLLDRVNTLLSKKVSHTSFLSLFSTILCIPHVMPQVLDVVLHSSVSESALLSTNVCLQDLVDTIIIFSPFYMLIINTSLLPKLSRRPE